MLDKKTVKSVLLEVEISCYNYEKYLQEIVDIVFNDNNNDIKYIITRENSYLCLYKYSASDYMLWLYDNIDNLQDLNELKNNYGFLLEYTQVQKNYFNYYAKNNILNFINVKKFRKKIYNNKSLLQLVINNIYTNVRNYANDNCLTYEYNLNKKLYHELEKIQAEA